MIKRRFAAASIYQGEEGQCDDQHETKTKKIRDMPTTTKTTMTENENGKDQDDDKQRKERSADDENDVEDVDISFPNEYSGHSFQQEDKDNSTNGNIMDVIDDPSSMSPTQFFDWYVRKRKPCIINGLPMVEKRNGHHDTTPYSTTSMNITRTLLEEHAGDKIIQVERRFHPKENFGQNRTTKRQVKLSISDFLKILLDHHHETNNDNINNDDDNAHDRTNEMYYWSTQEDTDDPYNTPCRELLDGGEIPATIPHAGNLILSSCNMWMGSSQEGASSGLHHDYHDNFYLLLQGQKRFRFFSPCYMCMGPLNESMRTDGLVM
jgi:hypothetical protein